MKTINHNEDFFEYILLHEGAIIKDSENNEIKSKFLNKMESKIETKG
jgi:hypothetical protein